MAVARVGANLLEFHKVDYLGVAYADEVWS